MDEQIVDDVWIDVRMHEWKDDDGLVCMQTE